MRLVLLIAGLAVAGLIGTWLVRRPRSNLGTAVTRQWLADQDYDRSGDEQ